MPFILAPLAAYLLLYAPGRALLRLSDDAPIPGHPQLLRIVLLSACCTSWVGFVLAELGYYSLGTLLTVLALVTLLARWRRRQAPRLRYAAPDWIGIGIVLITCLWVTPPLDTRILGSDSAGYLASGVQLAKHGTLVIHDPVLSALSPDLKRVLFPSVAPDRGSPPYLRLEGSLVMRSLDSDEVLPGFHHLLAVWVAATHTAIGAGAGEWIITLFAGLSMWAMVQFAHLTLGRSAAAIVLLLLSTLAPQYWYSRFLMPEVPGQFFLWGGLCCVVLHSRTRSRADAALAGLAFGIAGLMRIENVIFLFLAGALVWWARPRAHQNARPALLCFFAGALWMHAAIHLSVFRTHYFGNLRALIGDMLHIPYSGPVLVIFAAFLMSSILFAWWLSTRCSSRHRLVGLSLLLYALLGTGFFEDYLHGWESLRLLVAYAGVPTVAAGLLGLAWAMAGLSRRSSAERLLLTVAAVAIAQVMIQPHALPVPIWTVRRAVTVVLPALCLGVAEIFRRLPARPRVALTCVLVGWCLVAAAAPLAPLRQPQLYRGSRRHLEAIGSLVPSGACVLLDARLIGANFAPILWVERDAPVILMSPNDGARIREIARALPSVPLYWMNDGAMQPPQDSSLTLTPIASYEYAISTPALETGASPGLIEQWQTGLALYTIRLRDP